ncbi:hypothetical protein AAG570_008556 [Ranatra chinensis]|uniref:Uncharacterized protein n=1 Tax=Ranatra chinensis TaxID=642074 RepID=A0ABD0Z8C3_9HEMI
MFYENKKQEMTEIGTAVPKIGSPDRIGGVLSLRVVEEVSCVQVSVSAGYLEFGGCLLKSPLRCMADSCELPPEVPSQNGSRHCPCRSAHCKMAEGLNQENRQIRSFPIQLEVKSHYGDDKKNGGVKAGIPAEHL